MTAYTRNGLREEEPRLGDLMDDGTVYAGISPTTGTPMFVAPHDAPGLMTWKDAVRYAFNSEAHGYRGSRQQTEHDLTASQDDGGWRLPTMVELKQIHRGKELGALKGTFRDRVSLEVSHWYWSCTEIQGCEDHGVSGVQFTDGAEFDGFKGERGAFEGTASLRLVRTGPRH